MPQSLANILVHLVFSTKDREPLIDDLWRDELHGYIGGIIRRCGGDLLAANSVADHIHLFFPLPRTIAVADLVKEIKSGATKWIHEKFPRLGGFHWQAGYGVFSISPSHKPAVIRYIADQQEHHRNVSFQDEYRRLLEKYAIQYDERYVWD
jgi:putative transposase